MESRQSLKPREQAFFDDLDSFIGRAEKPGSRRKWVVLLGVLFVASLVLSAQVVTARLPTTGTRINLFFPGPCFTGFPDPPLAFPANSPFFVQHGSQWFGWSITSGANRSAFMAPTTTFKLLIDGVSQSTVNNFSYDSQTDIMNKLSLRNFPVGMPAGTYTLRGEWYLDGFLAGGVPGTSVFQFACDRTVTFA